MTSKYLISVGLLLTSILDDISAQDLPSIQLDRPDQTECPFIVPAHYIQVENGLSMENTTSKQQSFSYPSSLWKYGLNEKFEFRLITEISGFEIGKTKVSGLMPITLGFKTNICQEKGIIPITSFIGHITTSELGSKDFNTSYMAPSFRFTMQHTLSDIFSLAYNLGAEWNGESPVPTYIYTLTSGVSFSKSIGGYLELYGFADQFSPPDHRMDGGFTYLINNNLIADLSGGIGLSENAPNNYFAIGISYRLKVLKN